MFIILVTCNFTIPHTLFKCAPSIIAKPCEYYKTYVTLASASTIDPPSKVSLMTSDPDPLGAEKSLQSAVLNRLAYGIVLSSMFNFVCPIKINVLKV